MAEEEIITQSGDIKLTQFSRGAGCGCKIAPAQLEQILRSDVVQAHFPQLLVGNGNNDDAAVFEIGEGRAIISTTDFFMPVVDDAFTFGQIAAANALSDVFAMGGQPLMAVAILGWPVDKLPLDLAGKVLDGARAACADVHIPLAGGHSIDSTEPIFGLAVTGIINTKDLKKNNTAKEGDLVYLTKKIGTGILSTAQKRGLLDEKYLPAMTAQMTTINKIGALLAKEEVTAMTDVTGFGLLGHLIEMAEGADLSAEIYYDRLPVMDGAREYLSQRIVPDATYRNWNSYSVNTSFDKGVNVMEAFNLLPDPQTNGGILFTCPPSAQESIEKLLAGEGLQEFAIPVGRMAARTEKRVRVMKEA